MTETQRNAWFWAVLRLFMQETERNSLKMLDVTKWPIFSLLDPSEVAKIAKICVFGSSGNEAIYITKSDDVYAIGSNCSGCLGLGKANHLICDKVNCTEF